MRSHSYKRVSTLTAVVATAGLAAATAGFFAPAEAAGAPLAYTCNAFGQSMTFSVTNSSDAPASMYAGQSVPIKLTSTVTIPGSLTNAMYNLVGARSADGTAVAKGTAAGRPTTSTLSVPKTEVPNGTDMTVVATGEGGKFTPTKAGANALKAGDFTATLHLYKADGTPTSIASTATVPCTAPKGVDTTFSTIMVKKDTTTTAVAPKSKAGKVTAKVTVKAAHGGTTAGKVTVVVKKGKKTVEKKTVALKGGTATVKLPKKLKKGKYVVTAKYAGNGGFGGSTGKHTVKVK